MKDSHIQWTDNTFNGWEGCTKVSPGCLHCYAETRNVRFAGGANWGAGKPRRRTSESNWREPLRWNRAAQAAKIAYDERFAEALGGIDPRDVPYRAPRVFCASLSDWLDNEVPIEWLADLLTLIFDCGFLDWQLLTKRPENFRPRLNNASLYMRNHRPPTERQWAINKWLDDWLMGDPAPHNVWVGASVEDQLRANVRIPVLAAIPAITRFLSCEPLLGPVDLGRGLAFRNVIPFTETITNKRSIDWVIVGGESGADARPLELEWVDEIILRCRNAGAAVFVKQLGRNPKDGNVPVLLNHPKGGDPAEWPARLRLAEFPEVRP